MPGSHALSVSYVGVRVCHREVLRIVEDYCCSPYITSTAVLVEMSPPSLVHSSEGRARGAGVVKRCFGRRFQFSGTATEDYFV